MARPRFNLAPLEAAMLRQGMTRTELAQKAGMSPQGASDLFRRGSSHPRTVKRLAEIVGVDMAELVVIEPDPAPASSGAGEDPTAA